MNKKVFEKSLVVVLFVLVLVTFSFAERDSKKIERLYTTTQLLKDSGKQLSGVAAQLPAPQLPNN